MRREGEYTTIDLCVLVANDRSITDHEMEEEYEEEGVNVKSPRRDNVIRTEGESATC